MKPDLQSLINSQRVLICCGSGGVGKTSMAAAIALQAAIQGKKTIVLTIDPARRLANSLGIESIDYREKKIDAKEFAKAGITTQAPLYAMMLDTKRTFDAIIKKYASNPETAKTILENKLYQHLSNMIAGSQEYMAMEKLYEVLEEKDYDLVVLDTPPSRHALDFLDAPDKMSRMVGDSILKWFLKPTLFMGRKSLNLLDKGMKRVFKSFDKVTGFEFLQDLSEMLIATSGLLEGFHERAEKVKLLLHAPTTSFLLVAAPQSIPLREAGFFLSRIREYQLPFGGFIFNRVQVAPQEPDPSVKFLSKDCQQEYEDLRAMLHLLYQRQVQAITDFSKQQATDLSEKIPPYFTLRLPQLDSDIHDLKGLYQLAQLLLKPTQ